MGKGGATTGYKYSMTLLQCFCRGPINELVQIQVGGVYVWDPYGTTYESPDDEVNAPDAFGGDKKEGGVVGSMAQLQGAADQQPPNTLVKLLGATVVPGLRGLFAILFDGTICSNNPYPKQWQARIRRVDQGWQNSETWYAQQARITIDDGTKAGIMAMNPAHILYELSTNTLWGRGIPTALMDDVAWRCAADSLATEGFGLCLLWDRSSQSVTDFAQNVIDTIGASMYVARDTGLWTLRLIRDDYELDEIPIFDNTSGLLTVSSNSTSAPSTSYNEIIVPWVSSDGLTHNARVQNIAAQQGIGRVISNTTSYSGIPSAALALRVGQRDLQAVSSGIKGMQLTLDRRGWRIAPGGVIRIQAPEYGIADMILRVGTMNDDPTTGIITVGCVTDVFGLPDVSYVGVQETAWTAPNRLALDITYKQAFEAPYRFLYLNKNNVPDFGAMADDQGYLMAVAARPTGLSLSFDVQTEIEGVASDTFASHGTGAFSAFGKVKSALSYYGTTVVLTDVVDDDEIATGSAALIGNEWVRVDAYDATTATLTIARGVMDTIPATHPVGEQVFVVNNNGGYDNREYVAGEVVDAALLTQTNSSTLALADATIVKATMASRAARPYPPGNFQASGQPIFSNTALAKGADVVFTWAHRDRLLELDQLVEHGAADVGPEDGTTYNLTISKGSTVLQNITGLAATTWTYTAAQQTTDNAVGTITVTLESERGSLTSYQKYIAPLVLPGTTGYALAYGKSYGEAS